MSEQTGQPLEKISQDNDRDNFLSADSAVEYGLVDSILKQRLDK
jgi:ATP-dependent Clp protease protease subunit